MADKPLSPFDAQLQRCSEPGRICWIFELPGTLASPNRLLRVHWGSRHEYFQGFHKIAMTVRLQSNIPVAEKRRELFIIEYRQQLLDKDNLYGSVKPLVDGLKKEGLIVDDSEAWVELKVVQLQVKKSDEQKIQVILADVAASSSP